MTKTVTLRDDQLRLIEMFIDKGLNGYENNVDAASDHIIDLAVDFTIERLKELLEAFVAAKASADDPAGLDFDLPAPPPRDDPEPPVPPTVHGEPLPHPGVFESGEFDPTPTQKKAKSKVKLPASPTSRKTPNWTPREDEILLCYKDVEPKDWSEIEARLPGRNVSACKSRLKRLMPMEKAEKEASGPNVPREALDEALAFQRNTRREEPPVTVPKEELILGTDADGKVTSASTQEIVAKVQANSSWAYFDGTGIVPATAEQIERVQSHPAIKDEEPFIRQPTALEKMVGGFKRSGL